MTSAMQAAGAPAATPTTGARRTYVLVATLSLLAALAALAALATSASAQPADRAYEMVSPADKDSFDILPSGRAAEDGGAVAYVSYGPFGDGAGGGVGSFYSSERDADGWSLIPTVPALQPISGVNYLSAAAYSDDAKSTLFSIQGYTGEGAATTARNFVRVTSDGAENLITRNQPASARPLSYDSDDASADLSVVVFGARTNPAFPVTIGPAGLNNVTNLYAGDGTDVWLVSVLPDGTPSPTGGRAGVGQGVSGNGWNAVSEDGSRIFWTAGTGFGGLIYAWNRGGPTTQITNSAAYFQYATPDGSVAFYSTVSDIYRYSFATGETTNLTDGDPGGGALGVLGVSDDGERAYFSSTADLAAGATAGEDNVYLRDGDETTFVATLAGDDDDRANWAGGNYSFHGGTLSRVSPDGKVLLLTSSAQLTGYDNAGTKQLYRYDADADSLTCVSCPGDGAEPRDSAALTRRDGPVVSGAGMISLPRNLSDDGSRVFFVSPDALVPADTNGVYDVYLWEDGEVHLISSGKGTSDAAFVDASADGDDAFFVTRSRLVGIDTDDAVDLYDARVGGGLESQAAAPEDIPCSGDDCKPEPTDPGDDPTPGTGTVDDDGNSAQRCGTLERKAERTERKAERRAKQATGAKQKAKRLKRKAKHASGKRAKALNRKANHASHRAKQLRRRSRTASRKADRLARRATRCERRVAR